MSRLVQAVATLVVVGVIVTIGIFARGGQRANVLQATTAVGANGAAQNLPRSAAAAAAAVDLPPLTPAATLKELHGCNTYVSTVDGAIRLSN